MIYFLDAICFLLILLLIVFIFLFLYWGYHFFRKAYNYLDLLDYLNLQNKKLK